METVIPVEFQYLDRFIRGRLNSYFPSSEMDTEYELPPLDKWKLPIGGFIANHELSFQETHHAPNLPDTKCPS